MEKDLNIKERINTAVAVIAFNVAALQVKGMKAISIELPDRKAIKTFTLKDGYLVVADMLIDKTGYILESRDGRTGPVEEYEQFKPVREVLSVTELEELEKRFKVLKKGWEVTSTWISKDTHTVLDTKVEMLDSEPTSYSVCGGELSPKGVVVDIEVKRKTMLMLEEEWNSLITKWYVGE